MNNEERLAELINLCEAHGLVVRWADLGTGRHGQYLRKLGRIDLNVRLTLRQLVPCLAHEFAHSIYGDGCSLPWLERRAWEYAARMLITEDAYRQAEGIVGPHPNAIAAELDLTSTVVRAWKRQASRLSPATS